MAGPSHGVSAGSPPKNCAAVRRVTRRARPVGPMGPAASFSSNPINCGGGFGCVGGRGWARAGLPPTSTADPDHPLAAGAWSPPTRARKTARLAYRLQAGDGISGRTKHPRHSGGGALAGLAHYMLGWPGGGSRCADDPDLPFAQSHPPLTITAAPAVLAQGVPRLCTIRRFYIYYMFFNTDTSLLEKLNTKHVAV